MSENAWLLVAATFPTLVSSQLGSGFNWPPPRGLLGYLCSPSQTLCNSGLRGRSYFLLLQPRKPKLKEAEEGARVTQLFSGRAEIQTDLLFSLHRVLPEKVPSVASRKEGGAE